MQCLNNQHCFSASSLPSLVPTRAKILPNRPVISSKQAFIFCYTSLSQQLIILSTSLNLESIPHCTSLNQVSILKILLYKGLIVISKESANIGGYISFLFIKARASADMDSLKLLASKTAPLGDWLVFTIDYFYFRFWAVKRTSKFKIIDIEKIQVAIVNKVFEGVLSLEIG